MSIIQVESIFASSVAKIQRTQSVRVPTYNAETVPRAPQPPPPPPASSSSSTSSLSRIVESDLKTNPIAGTSKAFKTMESERRPLVEGAESKQKHVRIGGIDTVELIDPMAVTHGRPDPRRDGYFARVRNQLLRYGSATAVGYGLGVGGLAAAKEYLFPNVTINTSIIKQTSKNTSENLIAQTPLNKTVYKAADDDINNPF